MGTKYQRNVIQQKDDKFNLKMRTISSQNNIEVRSVELTLKGNKGSDLRVSYSVQNVFNDYTINSSIYGFCKIEKINSKMFGLLKMKQPLFESKCFLDKDNWEPGDGYTYIAPCTLSKGDLNRIFEQGEIIYPKGLSKPDKNLAAIEKLSRELVASQIEIVTDEFEKQRQLIEKQEKQEQVSKEASQQTAEEIQRQKIESIHSAATRFLSEDYGTAIKRLKTKISSNEAPITEAKSSNTNRHSSLNVSAINDGQRS